MLNFMPLKYPPALSHVLFQTNQISDAIVLLLTAGHMGKDLTAMVRMGHCLDCTFRSLSGGRHGHKKEL